MPLKNSLFSLLLLFLFICHSSHTPPMQANTPQKLIPIGASYEPVTLSLFAAQAIAYDSNNDIQIRLLPTPYASNHRWITPQERQDNYAQALQRASELENACVALLSPATTCTVTVPDIQTRPDAYNSTKVSQLIGDIDGIYIVGGDQTIAMRALANTPVENILETHYNNAVPFGGNSSGAAVQSRYMIAGYVANNSAWNGLEYGAVNLWYGAITNSQRGLRFGLSNGVIEQHTLERGRLWRLLQATQRLPEGVNHLGIGPDWGTAVVIENGQIVNQPTGATATIIVDEESYGSAANATYVGAKQILSIRNVAFHVLPEGDYGYDLLQHLPIINGQMDSFVPDIGGRNYNLLCGNNPTGNLLVTGDLGINPMGIVTQRFAALAQAAGGTKVVWAVGYASEGVALQEALLWKNSLQQLGVTNVQIALLTDNTNLEVLASQLSAASSIFVTGDDQQMLAGRIVDLQNAGIPTLLLQKWQNGGVLLFDDAAAAAVGQWMSDTPRPETTEEVEAQASDSFLAGYINSAPGLGLIPNTIFEPRLAYDYRYGRLVSHLWLHLNSVAFGLERGSAIEISPNSVQFRGDSAIMAMDGRYAGIRQTGNNNGMAITWLFLDSYAGTDSIALCP